MLQRVLVIVREDLNGLLDLVQVLYRKDPEPFPIITHSERDEIAACCDRAKDAYTDDESEKTALLIYNLINNHYLPNGNKRLALMLLTYLAPHVEDGKEVLKKVAASLREEEKATKTWLVSLIKPS